MVVVIDPMDAVRTWHTNGDFGTEGNSARVRSKGVEALEADYADLRGVWAYDRGKSDANVLESRGKHRFSARNVTNALRKSCRFVPHTTAGRWAWRTRDGRLWIFRLESEKRLLRLGVERIMSDDELVPGPCLGIAIQGRAGFTEIA